MMRKDELPGNQNRSYAMSEVAGITGGQLTGHAGTMVRFLLIDSRRLLLPAESLFFALRSKQDDGHRYIAELIQKGVRAFVVDHVPDAVASFREASFIVVDDVLEALQKLAAFHRSRHAIPVLAITGSNGKTVVKEWIFQALCDQHYMVRNPKSYNSQIGVPLSVWLMHDHHDLAVFEAGISQPGEMERLAAVLQPDIGLFTNIGPAHDEGFSSRKEKIQEKLKLFTHCRALIYCSDQEDVATEIGQWRQWHPDVRLFSWGSSPGDDIQLVQQEEMEGNTFVSVVYQDDMLMLTLPFQDEASAENAMHTIAFMHYIGSDDASIIKAVSKLQPVSMRLEMKEGVNNSLIVNDSYNADLHSLAIALDFLQSQAHGRKKTLILSDILQSGMSPHDLYAEVAALVRSKQVDQLAGIGTEIQNHAPKFDVPAVFYPSTEDFIEKTDFQQFRSEAILLKGARPFGFERISNILQQKDHETILEIDLDALAHNLNLYKSLLRPEVKLMGMVKAFSYGSGSVEVARMLQYYNADYLAVAYADEGKELRKGGVQIPLVVMNPEVRTFDTLFDYDLEPEIYGFPLLHRFLKATRAYAEDGQQDTPKQFSVHLKLDTGMHRLGFQMAQLDDLLGILRENPHIHVASVFSHLAASEDPAHDAFTRNQIRCYEEATEKIREALGYDFIRHICNSAAVSRFPEAHYDMVRVGIGLYGVSGDKELAPLLKNVSTFRSVVSQVKQVAAGDTVGYGRAGVADKEMTLAIVPVGYADGLNRQLGRGRGQLIIGGQRVPIVGNISMDMCAIDVTGLEVSEGDAVIIFGEELPVTEVAEVLGTIPYEVFTAVSQRVKRIYYQE